MRTAISRSARPVSFYADRYDSRCRAPLGAVSALFTARCLILADRVVSVLYDWRGHALICERLDGTAARIDFPRRLPSPMAHCLEWSLNREAALQDARRINSLACRMDRMDTVRRYEAYEDLAGLWHAFERAIDRAWDTSYCECPESHPAGDWMSPCRGWRRLDMPCLISGRAARRIYEAVALEHGLHLPEGEFDSGYGRNNLPYLSRAMDEEPGIDWAYRLYVCFSGPAPEEAAPVWHCVPGYRFVSPEPDESFDDMDDPAAPVRARAVRLA